MSAAIDLRCIEVLPSGRYKVRVQSHGTILRKTLDTVAEAILFRDGLTDEIQSANLVPSTGLSLVQWGPTWLQKYRSIKRGFSTERQRFWTHLSTASFARKPLASITRKEVKDWVFGLRKRKTQHKWGSAKRPPAKPLSLGTRRHILNLLKALFRDALEDEIIKVNVIFDLKIVEDATPIRDDLYLTLDEQAAVLSACGDNAERWIVAFALGTGLRMGEQWNLELADVHVEGSDPHVVIRYGSKGQTTKSGKVRRVNLFGLALDAARAWLALLPSYAPRNRHGLMFPTPRVGVREIAGGRGWRGGSRRGKGKIPKVWTIARAAVPRIVRWHDLRHTCASSLVAGWWGRAWRLEEVRAFLGHSTIRVTERYAHLAGTVLRDAATQTDHAWQAKPKKSSGGGGGNGGGAGGLPSDCPVGANSEVLAAYIGTSKPNVESSNLSGRTNRNHSGIGRNAEDARAVAGQFEESANVLLVALSEGREEDAWEAAQALAKRVLEDRAVSLARGVIEAGPYAMRRAVELAELLSPAVTVKDVREG